MPLRRTSATTAAAVLLAVPLLTSCGFNLSTDRVNDNTEGTGNRSGVVDVLAAVVVASQPDAGTFIATLSNNDQEAAHAFVSVESTGEGAATSEVVDDITIPPGGFVNLADGGGVKLTGDFDAGDILRLSVGFDDAETVDIDVPVVRACEEYADLDPAASTSPVSSSSSRPETADPSDAASDEASDEPSDAASDDPSNEATDEASDEGDGDTSDETSSEAGDESSPTATASTYSCSFPAFDDEPDDAEQGE